MSEPVSFDRIADRYDETRGGLERGREVADVFHGVLPRTGTLLEVGIGTGLVAAGLAERGRTVVGVDLSPRMLSHAAARLPGRLAVADARRLPLATASVAGVYLVHVLHLTGDLDATLAEAVRVVQPGGVVAATAQSRQEPQSDLHEILHDLQRGLPPRPDREDAVVDAAARQGLRLLDRRVASRGYLHLSPATVAQRLAERSWSWMWSVADAETWRSMAEPALARIRALPDQDRPRPDATSAPVLVFAPV